MTAPSSPAGLLLRLILVVIGLALPGMAPLAAGSASAESASTTPLRLAATAPAIRAADPEAPDTATPAAVPEPAHILRPDTASRRLTAPDISTPASLATLAPRARGPPLG